MSPVQSAMCSIPTTEAPKVESSGRQAPGDARRGRTLSSNPQRQPQRPGVLPCSSPALCSSPCIGVAPASALTDGPHQEARRDQRNTKQCGDQIDEVSDAMRLTPSKLRKDRECFKDVGQGHY